MDRYYGTNIQTAVRRDTPVELKHKMIEALDKLEHLSEKPLSARKQEDRTLLKKQLEKLESQTKD